MEVLADWSGQGHRKYNDERRASVSVRNIVYWIVCEIPALRNTGHRFSVLMIPVNLKPVDIRNGGMCYLVRYGLVYVKIIEYVHIAGPYFYLESIFHIIIER